MATRDLTAARLRELLVYDQEAGSLRWKPRPEHHFKSAWAFKVWNKKFSGRETGKSFDQRGYSRINIEGTPHLFHRLVWIIVYDQHPEEIDHINGNPADNRLCNLRACSHAENQHNQRRRVTNTSGFKGVCWHEQHNRWRAYIVLNRKQKHLGLFDTREEAYAAYCKAADEMHGEFANYGASRPVQTKTGDAS